MAILEAIGNGILYGVLLTFLIGPVFFALIQTSIEKGFASGASMAFGIAISDIIYILIASLSVALLAENQDFQAWLGGVGGLIMFIFGMVNLFKNVKVEQERSYDPSSKNVFRQMLKGLILNGINPFVLLFWLATASMVTLKFQYTIDMEVAFFGGVIVTVLLTDFLKAFAANKLSKLLSATFLKRMNQLVGVALIFFSFKLIHFALVAKNWL